MSDRSIYIGGLFRCCVQSIKEYDGPETEGTTVACRAHPQDGPQAVVEGGAWRWIGAAKALAARKK